MAVSSTVCPEVADPDCPVRRNKELFTTNYMEAPSVVAVDTGVWPPARTRGSGRFPLRLFAIGLQAMQN
jgi:hypothetical protein